MLAFATHALVAEELTGLSEPALVLTPPAKGTEQDDGLLTASEASLPETAGELLSLARTLGATDEALLLGTEATETRRQCFTPGVVSDQCSNFFGKARVRSWLQADIQRPEIDVCSTSNSGHSRGRH